MSEIMPNFKQTIFCEMYYMYWNSYEIWTPFKISVYKKIIYSIPRATNIAESTKHILVTYI